MTTPSPFSSFKNWLIFLLALTVVIVLLTKSCNKPNPVITQNQVVNDSVAKIVSNAKQMEVVINNLESDSLLLTVALENARDSLKQSTKVIHAANAQVTALANEVVDAKLHKDTAAYHSACDSLALANKAKDDKFNIFERDNKNALDRYDALSAKKSNIITALSSEANGYKSAAQMLQKQNATLVKAAEPKTQVFVGIEAEFSTINLFQSAGVGIEVKNKRDDQFLVGVGMMRQPVIPVPQFPGYARIGFYRKITIKN